MATNRWYDNATDLRAFLNVLIDAEVVEDTDDVQEFITKPQRFTEMYNAWDESGFVTSDDGEEWENFVNAISGEESEDES